MLGVSVLAQAQEKYGRFTAAELASLPQYCQDKKNNVNGERWARTFGRDNYMHIHHYCNGLIYFSRANMEIDAKRRRPYISSGLNGFNYVLRLWPANFQLYPLAQMYKQQLEMMRNWN